MIDTSKPGGLYKDQCYLKGAVMFLRQRKKIDLAGLFTGKISIEDLNKPKIRKVINTEEIKLPSFALNLQKYSQALDVIVRTNFIDTLPPLE